MHHHGHQHGTANILKWSFFATILFVVVEAVAGFRSGSLALVSDAEYDEDQLDAFLAVARKAADDALAPDRKSVV